MKFDRLAILSLLFAIAGVGLDGWCYWAMTQAKAAAVFAAQDADRCRSLATQIIALQDKPVVAGTQEHPFEQLTDRIEAAAKAYGIAGDTHLASIAPEQPTRVLDTAYIEKPTTIELRDAKLPQIIGLIERLALDGSALRVKSLRLTAPPHQEDGDLWSAELTVAYLIYSPIPSQPFNSERP